MKDQKFRDERTLSGLNKIYKSKVPPELQIHVSATYIAPGDPFALSKEGRMDKTGEICQYCVPIEPKHVGQLSLANIDNVFENLKQSLISALRRTGASRQGQ